MILWANQPRTQRRHRRHDHTFGAARSRPGAPLAACFLQVNNLREIQALRRLSPHQHIITLEEVRFSPLLPVAPRLLRLAPCGSPPAAPPLPSGHAPARTDTDIHTRSPRCFRAPRLAFGAIDPHPPTMQVLYDQPTGRLALVFELMDANFYELIRGRRHYLNANLIRSYMFQLVRALHHMHRKARL